MIRDLAPLRLPDGRDLAWCEVGPTDAARTAIYLHGTGGSRLEAGAMAAAAERYGLRIVAWNRPRHGTSTAVDGRRIEDVVADARAVIEAAGLTGEATPAAIGVSGGGVHVVALAALAPDLIRLAVPVNAGAPNDEAILARMPKQNANSIRLATTKPRLFALVAALQNLDSKLLRALTIRSLPPEDQAAVQDPAFGPLFERSAAEGRTQKGAWLEEARMFWTRPWPFAYDKFDVPMEVFTGEIDPFRPFAESLRDAGAGFHVFPGGHIAAFGRPAMDEIVRVAAA